MCHFPISTAQVHIVLVCVYICVSVCTLCMWYAHMCLRVSVPIHVLQREQRSLVSCSVILLFIPLRERKALNSELGPFVATSVTFYLDAGFKI